MIVVLIVVGLLAMLAVALAVLLTIGEVAAIGGAVLLVAVVAYGVGWAGPALRRFLAAALAVLFLAGGAYLGYAGYTLYSAFSDTSGPADPPDAAALASARAKLDAAQDVAGFRLELTDRELTAVLQDALRDAEQNPLRSVTLTVIDGRDGDNGHIDFEARFKGGSLTASGSVGARLDAGAIDVRVLDVGIGAVNIPGVARRALEDLVETVTDLNARLEEQRADVQTLEIGQGAVLTCTTTTSPT